MELTRLTMLALAIYATSKCKVELHDEVKILEILLELQEKIAVSIRIMMKNSIHWGIPTRNQRLLRCWLSIHWFIGRRGYFRS
jgi:hypothetical protein